MKPKLDRLDELVDLYLPVNPKVHDLPEIETGVDTFGFIQRIVINDVTGHNIAGNGRIKTLAKMQASGKKPPPNIEVDDDGEWLVPTDHVEVAEDLESAAALALNRIGEGDWNAEDLYSVLLSIEDEGVRDATGFSEKDIKELASLFEEQPDDKGKLLELVNLSGGDPVHVVEDGDVWKLGDRHLLICMSVFEGWSGWTYWLSKAGSGDDEVVFLPYPGPFVPLSMKADDHTFVMVQPDADICGYILDRYADVYGDAALSKVAP